MARSIMAHPYNTRVTLHLDQESLARAAFARRESREECLEQMQGALGYCLWECRNGVHIGVFDGKADTLVHEVVHCAVHILQNAGIDPTSNQAEPLAYLVDNLFGRLVGYLAAKAA